MRRAMQLAPGACGSPGPLAVSAPCARRSPRSGAWTYPLRAPGARGDSRRSRAAPGAAARRHRLASSQQHLARISVDALRALLAASPALRSLLLARAEDPSQDTMIFLSSGNNEKRFDPRLRDGTKASSSATNPRWEM